MRRATAKNSQITAQSGYYHRLLRRSETTAAHFVGTPAGGLQLAESARPTEVGPTKPDPRRTHAKRLLVVIVIVVVISFIVVGVDVAAAAAATRTVVVVIVVPGAHPFRDSRRMPEVEAYTAIVETLPRRIRG